MDRSVHYFDPALINNMVAAFEAVVARRLPQCADTPAGRASIARRIVDAARTGERDRYKLEMAANSQTTIEERLPAAHRSSS